MKNFIRKTFRQKRKELSNSRRVEALSLSIESLPITFKNHSHILSYMSFADEFCTQKINLALAKEGKLHLPKIENNSLRIFQVTSPSEQLKINAFGIYEPIPELCSETPFKLISLTLVPAIAFDGNNHRIGYGKGFYDRFLTRLPESTHTVGLGFKEQFSSTPLPIDSTDFALNSLSLF